ncbi:carbohydrate ABC transporter permease [Paenibacillus chitinolyticus]|uniref:Carbohydrate ABC transporter permease n=1 Tax=Paenibacillus chitinolyticus TaxID=79263 RepID=A0A410WS48_9BACL|nr:carbohydrate ABC transporter permease [Paenibacillus chitinolyticus]MCY9591322.1 carbohydrate ABC transporter permease [Paenibacillus chitinolyticus]MCY9595495.1 carbohydrate ABC transporter permease [Paenibacillus chitinolyticus]QAV17266.1 carbohydrate ABC transporter permease [Paenibacillus chitinolyticus]GKS10645.1 ABC transporter permease [Paenibacillus chitinolyticus]
MSLRKFDFWKLFNTVIIGLFSLCFLIPLLWMTSAAMKYEKDVMVFPIEWIPKAWNAVGNFKAVWAGNVPFHLFYFNSIKLSVIVTALTLIISSMAAFSFTKLNFRGRNIAFTLLLTFMIVPEQATLIPRFLLIRWLGLYDTHAALILMMMFSIYFTFLLRQFMMSIHSDFIEAAKIDGAGYFRIYWQIMLPLCKPILATVAIIKFIWTWNDYQMPLIFLLDKDLYPITLGIQLFKDDYADNFAVLMMASLSAIIPLLVIFIALQKQVIKGIALGGVKG